MFLFSFVSSGQLAVETKFTLCSLLKAEVLHGAIFVGILLNAREIFVVDDSGDGHFLSGRNYFVRTPTSALLS